MEEAMWLIVVASTDFCASHAMAHHPVPACICKWAVLAFSLTIPVMGVSQSCRRRLQIAALACPRQQEDCLSS